MIFDMNTNRSDLSNKAVIEQLEELGLSQHEALIYLSVLKHGESSAGIILDDVNLHREQVYRALKRLVDSGFLTSFEKRKRSYYSAIDPAVLVNQTKAKVAVAESLQPYLKELHQKKPQIIRVTEGEEAVKLQLEDIIETLGEGGEYLVLGGLGQQYYDSIGKYISLFEKKLNKKYIKGRILAYEGSVYPINTSFGEHISVKKIKRPADFPTSTVIYGNKVGIDLLDPQNTAIITIENDKVAESFKQTFEALWK